MNLRNLFKKKRKQEPDACEFDTLLALKCPVINPVYINNVTEVLRKVSMMYTHVSVNRKTRTYSFDNSFKYGHVSDKVRMLIILESELSETIRDFCKQHDIKVQVSINTDWESIQRFEDELIIDMHKIQGF